MLTGSAISNPPALNHEPSVMKETQWLFIGHGALASLWAHHLAANDASVVLLKRNADSVAELQLTLQTIPGQSVKRTFCVTDWQDVRAEQVKNSVIIVMVKAWQLDGVLRQLERYPAPEAMIISHNGLGAGESIIAAHPEWPVYDLVTTHGAWQKSPQHTVHAGAGQSVIGRRLTDSASAPCLNIPAWLPALEHALPPLTWEPDILLRRWQKLAINCAINPLATLSGQQNGVLQNEYYAPAIAQICAEVCAVANVILGQGMLRPAVIIEQVTEVIKATAANRCSMLQDSLAGRRTEIDYLNGYIATSGNHLGIPVPLNDYLYDAICRMSV